MITQCIVNSGDKAAIQEAIAGLRADEGMTALYKGVIDAVSLAAGGGRSAVIMITDGKNDPTEEMQRSRRRLQQPGTDQRKRVERRKGSRMRLYAQRWSDRNRRTAFCRFQQLRPTGWIDKQGRRGFFSLPSLRAGCIPELSDGKGRRRVAARSAREERFYR